MIDSNVVSFRKVEFNDKQNILFISASMFLYKAMSEIKGRYENQNESKRK